MADDMLGVDVRVQRRDYSIDAMLLVMSNTSQKACQQRSGLRNGMAKPPACLDAACGEGSLDVVQEI